MAGHRGRQRAGLGRDQILRIAASVWRLLLQTTDVFRLMLPMKPQFAADQMLGGVNATWGIFIVLAFCNDCALARL